MKRSSNIFLMTLFSGILFGCATTALERRDFKSYYIGQILSSPVGGTFLVDQSGSVSKVRTWVGIINSPDGWRVEERYSEDFLRRELLYSGVSENIIEISYREYRGGLAAPAFYQNLKYDLSESAVITFQNFEIEVITANNREIECRLLKD